MADFTMAAGDQVVPEIALAAGVAKTVAVTSKDWIEDGLIIQQLTGASPVYAKVGTTIAAKDPAATFVVAGQWSSINDQSRSRTVTIAIVSAAAATVSLYRK